MPDAHLDHPGEVSWYKGYGPAPVIGSCTHNCQHLDQSVIGWGPSMERYELIHCTTAGRCAGGCRAWVDGQGRVTTAWLQVEAPRMPHRGAVAAAGQPASTKEPGLWLGASCLLSKYGFDDGSPFDDYIDWCEDNEHPRPQDEEEDELLRALVRTYLVPALDQRVELVDIETSHNPIRAGTVDGVDVEDCWTCGSLPRPVLTPDGVTVPFTDVLRTYQGSGS